MRSAAILPLVVRGRVMGALFLAVHTGRELDAETIALGEELAARAGVAIDNARLFTARTAAARTLQASLLPPALPFIDGVDLGARYVAGSSGLDVGGDFYDVFPLYGDRHLLVLGDVRGRGVDAANAALLIRLVIRSAAVGLRTPAAILTHLNEVLLRQESDELEPRFATAVLAVVHPRPDGSLAVHFAVAGHPLPLLRGPDASVRTVGCPGTALGITEAFGVTDARIALGPGEALLFFTDGATERRGGAEFFGDERLAAAFASAAGNADAVAASVENAVSAFAEDDLTDDLALLVVRSAPRPAAVDDERTDTDDLPASMRLPREPASTPAARRFLSARLRHRCADEVIETAILLASELVTNAVRYGSDPIELEVALTPDAEALKVTVSDANPAPPLLRPALLDDTGGRGLHLLGALSDAWGHDPHGSGKSVWFTLKLHCS
jgi:serine phosphatase RsbU (regulator of sigma subunit)/anti-sigma regulatory factor (Ser/Thr protein kinase)